MYVNCKYDTYFGHVRVACYVNMKGTYVCFAFDPEIPQIEELFFFRVWSQLNCYLYDDDDDDGEVVEDLFLD